MKGLDISFQKKRQKERQGRKGGRKGREVEKNSDDMQVQIAYYTCQNCQQVSSTSLEELIAKPYPVTTPLSRQRYFISI